MRADDLTVTVRDKTLARVGTIPPHLLEGTFVIPDTAVGDWKLRLPADHAMAALLRTPGYGIIVDGPNGTLFSGPMVKSTRDSDYRDEAGTVTIEGVTDEIILWDALAYPPEGFAYDTFTGEPWEIFDHFLDFNLGDLGRFPLGSFGNLLTTDFSSVDGTGGGGNLIPNPDPQPTGAYDFGVADATGSGWSSSASWYGIVNYCGPDVERTEAVTTSLASEDTLASHTVWPVPTGTGGVPVTAASSYTIACHVYAYDGPSAAPTISVGVEWFDAAGDAISAADSTGITPSSTTSDLWLNVDGPFYYTGFFANPSETFTAPAGAAFARPRAIVVAGDASINEVYVAAFSMVAA